MGCFVPVAPGVGVGEVVVVGVGLPSEVRVGVGVAVGEAPAQLKETAISKEIPDTRRKDFHQQKYRMNYVSLFARSNVRRRSARL